MADTTFVNGSTLSDQDWFNDVNRLHYTILNDPADAAAVKTALLGTATDGKLIIGKTSDGSWNAATLTAGTNVTITNGAGAITISSTGDASAAYVKLQTAVSASGTSIDFTGIPSGAKRVSVIFGNLSTNGASYPLIQLGSGSVTTSGYTSASGRTNSANNAAMATSTAGFLIMNAGASDSLCGIITIDLLTSNTWVSSGVLTDATSIISMTTAGSIALGGALDRVRITTVNGTDTFDAGTVNISYEL